MKKKGIAGFSIALLFISSSVMADVTNMNMDQVKGTTKDISGKIQEKSGKITGSKEDQAKGLAKQAEGKTQKGFGDVKEAIKDGVDKL